MNIVEAKHLDPKEIIYIDGEPGEEWDDTAARFRKMGTEVRRGAVHACEVCGFLSMRGADDHVVVFNYCVCDLRKTHSPKCMFLRAAETKIDVGCFCDNDSTQCPVCYTCDCEAGR